MCPDMPTICAAYLRIRWTQSRGLDQLVWVSFSEDLLLLPLLVMLLLLQHAHNFRCVFCCPGNHMLTYSSSSTQKGPAFRKKNGNFIVKL